MVEIELGQAFAATKAPVAKPVAEVSSSVGVAVIASVAPVTVGLVLPCPPSEAEKVRYANRQRVPGGKGGGGWLSSTTPNGARRDQ